jgi:hypothetical protein
VTAGAWLLPTTILIEDRYEYTFPTKFDGIENSDSVINVNEFKKTPGVVYDEHGNLLEGATVTLEIPGSVQYDGNNPLVATTDEDGWYMIEYKHKGKPTDYPLKVEMAGYVTVDTIVGLKGNAFEEMSFTLQEVLP